MAQEANGGAPKGDRKPEWKIVPPAVTSHNWPHTGLVSRHESALTWARWAFDELKPKQRNRRTS
jgi:hypothetical protein